MDHLIEEALALTAEERSALALALLDSLASEDENVAKAWADEIRKRRSELRAARVQASPWDEAKARLNAL